MCVEALENVIEDEPHFITKIVDNDMRGLMVLGDKSSRESMLEQYVERAYWGGSEFEVRRRLARTGQVYGQKGWLVEIFFDNEKGEGEWVERLFVCDVEGKGCDRERSGNGFASSMFVNSWNKNPFPLANEGVESRVGTLSQKNSDVGISICLVAGMGDMTMEGSYLGRWAPLYGHSGWVSSSVFICHSKLEHVSSQKLIGKLFFSAKDIFGFVVEGLNWLGLGGRFVSLENYIVMATSMNVHNRL
ncbi:hypothetical protein Tco_0104430 [Tanacetum coccineum]